MENRTLSSSHVDSSHVTQIKNGVWPGTGFEWQMVSTFSVRKFRLGIWTTSRDVPFILENFRSGKPKRSYHLHPDRNFRNFSVNGKQPTSRDVPFILENFRSGKPKRSYHLHPNRNFRNFSVNGNFRDIEHIYRITPTLSSVRLNKSDLLRRIKAIKPNKASGPDSIAPRDFHLIGEASAAGLYTVLRHSLLDSTVPTQWKVSRMLTTHKKGNKTVRGNYRPLQMLSLPSKLLEGLVCEGLDNFTTETGQLNDSQWGFRQGRSTEDILIYLTETWKSS